MAQNIKMGEELPTAKVGDGPKDIHPMRARNIDRTWDLAKLILRDETITSLPMARRRSMEEFGWGEDESKVVLLLLKWWYQLVAKYKPEGMIYNSYLALIARRRSQAPTVEPEASEAPE